MPIAALALLLTAALGHATWNYLAKGARNDLAFTFAFLLCSVAVYLPLNIAVLLFADPELTWKGGGFVAVSAFFHIAYYFMLTQGYRVGDLSLVYPLARGSAPLLAVAIGVIVLGERLGLVGFLGVAALIAGILALQRPWRYLRESGREHGGAAGFALLTGITIAAYSAVDRVGVRGTEPWIYAALIYATGTVFLAGYVWMYRRRDQATATAPKPPFSARRAGIGGMITLVAYLLILTAFTVAPLTAVAPLRESAIVLASGWGALRLREADDRADAVRRIGAAALVVLGALLLAFD